MQVFNSERIRADGKFFARGAERLRISGVTYGPFAARENGETFPTPSDVADDFARMEAIGINTLRTYHVPPAWFLELCDERGLNLLIGVPWTWQVCFLDDDAIRREARQAVKQAAQQARGHRCVLGLVLANEISPDIVRWHGATRIGEFLAELMDIAKGVDPDLLCTSASFPPTEYLDLSFLDFATFNVYLHDMTPFRRYLFRLQNLTGDRPLVLGELGMDTLRHPETEQANFLAGHLREAILMGVAGAFVFAWTDDWHTGGFQIEDWAFGLTRRDRAPKISYYAMGEVFGHSPSQLLEKTPRVSVVVCSYNGGATLDECLRSLLALDYPDFEVVLVDDGSTDDTRAIAARFPTVRAIHQSNQGLSAARNVGLDAASGDIVAYTDSDCFADAHWLTHLVHQLQGCGAAGVGGPNLSPDDGWVAACVAASPGQPTHVLESDQSAEHVPGCNMAFHRAALLAVNGFAAQYRKAGDDVDLCWRLEDMGCWISFAPGAFVWHHRRQNPRAYLKQQAGYGEAEGLLWFDHPDRFNAGGAAKWRGVAYDAASEGLRFGEPTIYRGVWGSGLFQTLYQPGVAHWASLPSTLEWHAGIALLVLISLLWPGAGIVFGVLHIGHWKLHPNHFSLLLMMALLMMGTSVATAVLRAFQAPLAPRYESIKARLLIAALCYAQPLVRSWRRYGTRLIPPVVAARQASETAKRVSLWALWTGRLRVSYWNEEWRERTEILERLSAALRERNWTICLDSGWCPWDIAVYCTPWAILHFYSAQEDHSHGKRLLRARYHLRPTGYARALGWVGFFAALLATISRSASASIGALLFAAAFGLAWRVGTRTARQAMAVMDDEAAATGLFRLDDAPGARRADSPLAASPLQKPVETLVKIEPERGDALL